ncbi:PhnD/SsuA/transferrin family substrate-binding protein [Sulfitobacter sp. JBTF-M27]|uniref:histidine kinase n=2 Tax=Sulfitobacter sediminilitoris TaxID=2698830 RepID=A0A6P0CCD7_9RHOB|nr:PhnD/SsuA/transferrin family substrate-binding protein [Sulfitobacter sediminilitoris]
MSSVFRIGQGFVLALILTALSVLATPSRAQETSPQPIKQLTLGILATEGATRALEAWTPTQGLLNRAASAQNLPYRFKIEPHTDTSLISGLGEGNIDLLLGDPAAFVVAEVEEGVRALLSVAHMWDGTTYDRTGAVVFVRNDSGIRQFNDIAGERIMGVTANELTGWQLALQEFRKYRLSPDDMAADVLFSGGNQREVVYAVQNDLVDVGVIRAGVLEYLAQQGAISLDDFRPIQPIVHEGYPFWASTPLYPDWVMAAMPDVPEDALALLIETLLNVTPSNVESQAANGVLWQAPQNYQAVHELLISLRARPYENYLRQAATRIYLAYKWPVIGLSALILLSLVLLGYALLRNASLAEARKNVLQSEVRSKQFYRNAIEDHTVFCMLTKDGIISHMNEQFVTALKRSRNSLMNTPLAEIMKETNRQMLEGEIMAAMNAGVPWQGALQLTKQDGKSAWVQSTFIPVTGTSRKLSEIAIVASDVTSTRKGVSETRFNDTLELIQDQIVVMRPVSLEITYANTAAVQTLFEDRVGGTWKGKKAGDFIMEKDLQTLKMRCEAIEMGPQRRITWEAAGKNDVTYEISLEYVQPEQDEPRLIAIYRDVSERKIIERAKNEFIATVSHELRTPLTSIKGALGLAMSGAVGEMPEKMGGVVDMAATSCDRLVVLINDILDLEKIESGKMDFQMQLFDIDQLVTDALQSNAFYAEKFNVSIDRLPQPEDESYMTYGDPARLTQVMDNLISNAAKFSKTGTKIEVGLSRKADRLRITIRDFGDGIPEKAQPTIFEKFTQADSSDTRSKGGTGLGLSIVKLIVEHHQGRVSFVSKEGVGTEFFVDLPMVDGEKVIPIPRIAEESDLPVAFSNGAALSLADAPETPVQEVVHRLLDLSRKSGLEAKSEVAQVTVKQLAKGRGVVGNSSAMTWLGAGQRGVLSDLIKADSMDDRDVCVIEFSQAADPANTITKRNMASTTLMQDWLAACSDLMDQAGTPAVAAITGDAALQTWLKKQGIETFDESAQAFAHSGWANVDLLAQFGSMNDGATMALYPKSNSKLPPEWPMVLIVSRMEEAQSGRGVVSKFSSGGGGRGRRRA